MFWSKAKDTIVANPTTISPSSLSPPTTSVSLETPIVRPSDFFKYGFPGPIHDLQTRAEFVSVYNRQTRNPYYVVEHLTPDSLASHNADRKNSFFKEDEQIPSIFRARLKDYFRSGYDRGHQAPAANAKFSQNAMDETFFLTNMSPQVGDGFNRDYWAHLEYFTRTLTQYFRSVRIVTGPLFLPKQDPNDGKWKVTYELIGSPPSVAVPTHFFKLVVAEDPKNRRNPGDVALAAFVLPNEPIPNSVKLTDFEVPLEALERATGLEFMRKLEPQKQKPLCKEVKCELIIRDFNNNIKQLPLPQK
ncbi:Mitochondrial nuclease [Komagataella phaffii CBS 7435]|uniref:Endonuclease n=1 Tax=Komagataella phaffii (strain ATCC 76273 / CBS 7435 / CECT 11047 / NRRL Y-11430 / Wegner 21-1) TaxID=981350 RepID=F2QXY4_KOMPC|nr:GQ67_05259T0 [Komagataella phaffii]AOA70293.1 GQ68_05241T0 [Komagataella phaffii GS115]CAH2450455.1 Mitochondrial nuclease [Komagataella phaffii CBS 7435]CCA40262.1 Mitochondrial nuclease [Komagataella phaffii CBS 7435]